MFLPLMPKGVEHPASFARPSSSGTVFLPLMPKGVEHMATLPDRRRGCTMCSFR